MSRKSATTHAVLNPAGEEVYRGTQAVARQAAWHRAGAAARAGEPDGAFVVVGVHTGTEFHREEIAAQRRPLKRARPTAAERRLARAMFGSAAR